MMNFLRKLVGDTNEKAVRSVEPMVQQINRFEETMQAKTLAQLREQTDIFRERLSNGETTDDLLPEAFATVREVARRTIGLRHYDVQLLGGIVLHQGNIAEMKTGEGKTLVATLPLYLNALESQGCHLVTVNDYLARRDAGWMGPVFHHLGLSVGFIAHSYSALFDPEYVDPTASLDDERLVHWRPCTRHEAYAADITYGTNNEFGFDYLRDNMVQNLKQMVQRGHHYAIIDEVDNILIDEARTPLIISGPASESSRQYGRFARLVRSLNLQKSSVTPDEVSKGAEPDGDVLIDLKSRSVMLTEKGLERVEQRIEELGEGESVYDPEHSDLTHYLENALKAQFMYERDKEYVVTNHKEVVIVDEHTGRMMPGRRWSDGLHQAIEAKENVEVRREQVTYATITFQNFFRLYDKLAGMTGTAYTEREEFGKIYQLDVVIIPTNREVVREDITDSIYGKEESKFRALISEISDCVSHGRPVLVGTTSVETSERLSSVLRKEKIAHEVLNAKHNEQEARIIAQAGQPSAVTIATNMAGRGTDILLGGNVEALAARYLEQHGCSRELLEKAAHLLFISRQETQLQKLIRESNGQLTDDLLEAMRHLEDQYQKQMGSMNKYLRIEYRALIRTILDKRGQTSTKKGKHYQEQCIAAILRGDAAESRDLLRKLELPEERITEVQRRHHDYVRNYLVGSGLAHSAASPKQKRELVWLVLRNDTNAAQQLVNQIDDLDESCIALLQNLVHDYNTYHQLAYRHGSRRDEYHLFVAGKLFDQVYLARAKLVQLTLQGNLEAAQQLVNETPGLQPVCIDDLLAIQKTCREQYQRVIEAGGLHVIGTERHDSRRIDNQLRGRAGRQGDPGSSRFFISLDDDVMRRFGHIDKVKGVMDRLGIDEDMPIESRLVTKQIESAQARVEGYNFDMRKHTVDYDNVMNRQREVIYTRRRRILKGAEDQQALEDLIARYLYHYPGWVLNEVRTAITTANDAIQARLDELLPETELTVARVREHDANDTLAESLSYHIEQQQKQHAHITLLVDDLADLLELPEDAETQLQACSRTPAETQVLAWYEAYTDATPDAEMRQNLVALLDRYMVQFEDWVLAELRAAIEQADQTFQERLQQLLPSATLQDVDLVAVQTDDEQTLPNLLQPIIHEQIEQQQPVRLLVAELRTMIALPDDAEAQLQALSYPSKDQDLRKLERLVYDWWHESNEDSLEEQIKELFDHEFEKLVSRYRENYENWMHEQINLAIAESTRPITDDINGRLVQRRLSPLLPDLESYDPTNLQEMSADQLQRTLETMVKDNRARGYHTELLAREINRVMPMLPEAPDFMRWSAIASAERQQYATNYRIYYNFMLARLMSALREDQWQPWMTQAQRHLDAQIEPVLQRSTLLKKQEYETMLHDFYTNTRDVWITVIEALPDDVLLEFLSDMIDEVFDDWRSTLRGGRISMARYQQNLILAQLDQEWQRYLTDMDDLRQGIGLQAIGQRDPLVQYQTEGYRMFAALLDRIDETVVRSFFLQTTYRAKVTQYHFGLALDPKNNQAIGDISPDATEETVALEPVGTAVTASDAMVVSLQNQSAVSAVSNGERQTETTHAVATSDAPEAPPTDETPAPAKARGRSVPGDSAPRPSVGAVSQQHRPLRPKAKRRRGDKIALSLDCKQPCQTGQGCLCCDACCNHVC
ncbi:MAG: preprotein translocase subunit SecA [Chloroflexaceae bacterium]|nr:preprotein translocase subunit SecA [Chloroflexaceae bacterium]